MSDTLKLSTSNSYAGEGPIPAPLKATWEKYGLAVDWDDNLYVANNPPSAPAFIQKFNPSGVPSSFAAGISSQPNIRGMTFDLKRGGRIDERDRGLYAALGAENEILKFDTTGISSLFANVTDGLDFPVSIIKCRH